MGQSMVFNSHNYGDYTERIRYLRSNGDHLLQEIELLEINMNKRKQQNQQPLKNELTRLHTMTTKLLQMLAEINVCQYFQMVNEYFNFNDYYYKQMCFRYYQDLLKELNFKLKYKNLIDDNNDNDNDNDDNDIDFSINRSFDKAI